MTTASRPDEIEPKFEWVQKDGCDTLLVHLPGYKRENLKVQVTTSRNLRVFGDRKMNDKKSVRFHKEFNLPNECDINGITAKFEKEVLQIRLPTKTSSVSTSASAGEQKARAEVKTSKEDHEQEEKNKGGEAQGEVSKGKYTEKKMTSIRKMMRKRGTLIAVVIVAVGVAIALGVGLLH